MPRPRVAGRLAVTALLSLSSCQFDASVQGLPRIHCDSDAQCPASMTCRASVSRCLPKDPPEKNPPFIEERLVFPDIGSFGQRFSLGLRASETLLEPPIVHVVASDGRELSPVVRDESELPEREYRFYYDAPTAAGPSVPEGLTRVVADLVDAVGNSSERLEVGSFTLDFTAPEVIAQAADVTLTPGPGNPLTVVTALTEGSTARVSFVASEPLLDAQLTSNVPGLQLVRTGGEVTSYVFTGFLADAGLIESEVLLDLNATDRAGNPILNSRLALRPALRVDTIPPAEPATLAARAVVYTRAPLGELNGRGPYFEVAGDGGSAEPSSHLMVREPGSDSVVAQAVVTDAGSFGPISLGVANRAVVFVSAVDGAGNESPRVPVSDYSYVASLRGKVPGSVIENPHRLDGLATFGPQVEQPGATEVATLPSVVHGGGSWQSRDLSSSGPLECASFTTDLRRGTVVAFQFTGTEAPSTWVWNGNDWRALTPPDPELDGNPAAIATTLGYDDARDRVVAVVNNGLSADTWEFDGTSWRHFAAGAWSTTSAMAYWPTLGRMLAIEPAGQIVSWNGLVWSGLPSYAPGLYPVLTAAPDRKSGAVLAINGSAQTWAFDGGWQQLAVDAGLSGAFGQPHVRLVDDPGTGALWLIEEAQLNHVRARRWLGPTAGWSAPVETVATYSAGFCGPTGAAWDPLNDRVLLQDSIGRATYAIDGDGGMTVARLVDPALASGSVGARGAFSTSLGALAVLAPLPPDLSQLLTYDGKSFSRYPPNPAGRLGYAGVLEDPASGGVLVHGGKRADGGTSAATWLFLPDSGWQSLDAGGPAVAAFAWSPSSAHGGVLLHGGITGAAQGSFADIALTDTWLLPYDGGGWRYLSDAGTDRAAFHQMRCDAFGTSCLLGPSVSNGSSNNRTFQGPQADGGLWTPSAIFLGGGPAVAYGWARDPAWSLPIAFGGTPYSLTSLSTGTWSVVPNFLQPFAPLADEAGDGDPPPRLHPVLAYDPARRVTVMLGGLQADGGAAPLDQPWEFHYGDSRPGAVFALDLVRAPVGLEAEPTGLRINAACDGTGRSADGGSATSVELLVAAAGHWKSLGPVPPDGGTVTVSDPALLQALLKGQHVLRAAVAPVGTNGTSPSNLTVRRFDITVDYRIP